MLISLLANLFKKKNVPEVYIERDLEAVETHILSHFGKFDEVIHEIVSPDVHVDVCIIAPTPERNYYTLVTMGMGAHRMNIPKALSKKQFSRAELLITLPPHWDIRSSDERLYWPIRWLKILARLPLQNKTWLGYGHTIPAGEPFAENTALCGMMLTMPYYFGNEASICQIPSGDNVCFYQLMPLYENEMHFKLENSAGDLDALFPDDFSMVVDINRENVIRAE